MLAVDHLVKRYAAQGPGVQGVSFHVTPGEFFTLLGPSGCGKTTTLRCIAGLETPDSGTITLAGQQVFGPRTHIPVQKRDIAMVFQSYAIWPHMTVAENIAFPLEAQRVARPERRRRVDQALVMVGLETLGGRSASLLSGGQQQRVALARAAVRGARLLLLDEPLSNLDASLRERMRVELRDLQQRLGTTAVYVTHDQEEAMSLSDRVALMRNGQIVELDTPETLYLRPRNPFTARFLGLAELLPCRDPHPQGPLVRVTTPLGPLLATPPQDLPAGPLHLLIRPEHIRVAASGANPKTAASGANPKTAASGANPKTAASGANPKIGASCANTLQGTVRRAAFAGRHVDYSITVDGHDIPVQAPSGHLHRPGEPITITLPPEHCILLAGNPD